MAMCTGCHKQISAGESKRQTAVKDDQGRIVQLFHGKCWVRKKRQAWVGSPSGKYSEDSPDAYQMAERRVTADDLSPEAVAHQADIEQAWKQFRDGRAVAPEILDAVVVEQMQRRQAELSAERAKESSPRRHDDWRDPIEAEF